MNQKQHLIPQRNLRFRRWSRKGYAAFASIGACVSIGQVCKSIVESALRKQSAPNAIACTHAPTGEENLRQEEDIAPVPTETQELSMLLLSLQQTEANAAVVTSAHAATRIAITIQRGCSPYTGRAASFCIHPHP